MWNPGGTVFQFLISGINSLGIQASFSALIIALIGAVIVFNQTWFLRLSYVRHLFLDLDKVRLF